MLVRFWGVRGSLPSAVTADIIEAKIKKVLELASPGDVLSKESVEHFVRTLPFSLRGTYGGNTTCLEIRNQTNDLVIIDAGTGLRRLGSSIMQEEKISTKAEINFFFTHAHWDHIQGFLFFAPLFVSDNKIIIHSSFKDFEERLRYQQKTTHAPITLDEFPASIHFKYLKEGETITVKDMDVVSKFVRHPGGNYTFKFKQGHRTFIFCSDAEFNLETMEFIEEYIDFFKDADVLVFDTQYTFEESLQKIDWGHSSAAIATDIAVKSNTKRLILFHHDPSYDDEKMDALTIKALKYKNMMFPNSTLEIEAAYEGLEITI